jgi:universal stress protein F
MICIMVPGLARLHGGASTKELPMAYHNILVPLDFDNAVLAGNALDMARALAAPGAKVTLLHVMAPAPLFAVDYLPPGWRAEMQQAIEAEMRRLSAPLETIGLREIDVVVAEGEPGPAILDWARTENCDCIIIASHRPGLRDHLLGSTASKVVKHAPCAVHVLR